MNKRVLLAVPLILIGGAIVFLMTSRGGETDNTLFASGTIEATDADLGFQLPGRVATIAPREGEHVEAGVELARLDTRELES